MFCVSFLFTLLCCFSCFDRDCDRTTNKNCLRLILPQCLRREDIRRTRWWERDVTVSHIMSTVRKQNYECRCLTPSSLSPPNSPQDSSPWKVLSIQGGFPFSSSTTQQATSQTHPEVSLRGDCRSQVGHTDYPSPVTLHCHLEVSRHGI